MKLMIFETLDQEGELWECIELHKLLPVDDVVFQTSVVVPSRGTFRIASGENFLEAEYVVPDLQIEKYNPCEIRDSYFTDELHKNWKKLPEIYEVESEVATFGFRRVAPDALLVSPDGRLYVYELIMVCLV